jgi:hypothetical protein
MTPKAQFAQRCEAFLKDWDVYDRHEVEPAVRRLCSDERAQSLWALCKTLDDGAFRNVMESVVPFSEPKLQAQELQRPQRDYEQTAQRLEIVRRFLALITDPQEGVNWYLPWDSVKLTPEYYIAQTKALEGGLESTMEWFDELRREASAIHSRKGFVPNTLSALARGMKSATGNLHLDVVADIASIFLDQIITADQVRKAHARAEERWQKWRADAERRQGQRAKEDRRRFEETATTFRKK